MAATGTGSAYGNSEKFVKGKQAALKSNESVDSPDQGFLAQLSHLLTTPAING